jgi:antitoxin MazE
MEVERKIRRVGNSLGITLPSDMLKNLGIEEGGTVYVSSEKDCIVIRRSPKNEQEDAFRKRVIEIIEEWAENRD